MKEFGRFPLKGVADELQGPSDQEADDRPLEKPVYEDRGDKQGEADHDDRNAKRVASAVHRVLVAGRVLRDPLLVAFSAPHVPEWYTGMAFPGAASCSSSGN